MKILIVNSTGINGGAGRAAYRLHKALLNENIDSQLLGQKKNSDDYTVLGPKTKMEILVAKARAFLDEVITKRYNIKSLFSPSWIPFSNFSNKINKLNPDVVHLHWMEGGMMRVEDLKKIKAPIVWSLQDMWVFTGGCHYAGSCHKYVSGCFQCPILGSENKNDLSKNVFKRKLRHWKNLNLTIVSPSRWLADCARNSLLLKNARIEIIPYNIDTGIYKPIDKIAARTIMNLPVNKSIVLFGANNGLGDERKGISFLLDALQKIPLGRRENLSLVIFGSSKPKIPLINNFEVFYMGALMDDQSLAVMYSCADVFIAPSLEDNLPLTVMESLACGTPVVAFNIGGMPDMIEHKLNGYLARPYESEDLAAGIEWILENPERKILMEKASRKKVLNNYTSDIIVEKYKKIYDSVKIR